MWLLRDERVEIPLGGRTLSYIGSILNYYTEVRGEVSLLFLQAADDPRV